MECDIDTVALVNEDSFSWDTASSGNGTMEIRSVMATMRVQVDALALKAIRSYTSVEDGKVDIDVCTKNRRNDSRCQKTGDEGEHQW